MFTEKKSSSLTDSHIIALLSLYFFPQKIFRIYKGHKESQGYLCTIDKFVLLVNIEGKHC